MAGSLSPFGGASHRESRCRGEKGPEGDRGPRTTRLDGSSVRPLGARKGPQHMWRAGAFDVEVKEKSTMFRTTLDGPPNMVVIDPRLHVLKTIETEKPLAMWIEQARKPVNGSGGSGGGGGPTIAARHEAVESLAQHDLSGVVELLAAIVRDESERHSLRNAASIRWRSWARRRGAITAAGDHQGSSGGGARSRAADRQAARVSKGRSRRDRGAGCSRRRQLYHARGGD